MKPLIFFLFLVFVPSVLAFDCTSLDSSVYGDCVYLADVNESLIANLIYTSSFTPDHNFVREYNNDISVVKPSAVSTQSSSYIKNAWLSIIRAQPTVLYNGLVYAENIVTVYSDYDYSVSVPSNYYNDRKRNGRTCQILYNLHSNSATFSYSVGALTTHSPISTFSFSNVVTVTARLDIQVTIRAREYEWDRDDGRWYCEYDRTYYPSTSMTLYDSIDLYPYTSTPASFEIQAEYYDTIRGVLNNSGNNIILNLSNGSYVEQNMQYSAVFTNPPNNFLQIVAENISSVKTDRINKQDSVLLGIAGESCSLYQIDFFDSSTSACIDATDEYELEQFEKKEWMFNIRLIIQLLLIGFVIYISFRLMKHYWGKIIPLLILPLLFIPSAHASECGLTNLGSCIPEAIFDFVSGIINAPIQPLISAIRYLMENAVIVDPFFEIWQIIVYIMGFFYLIMLTFAGFSFITSGHDVIKRENAKEWVKNTFLVIIFTSASFYLYQLVLEVSAVLTSSFISTVPEEFFLFTIDNIPNIALQFFSAVSYFIVLGITVLILGIRYVVTAIGVIFIPSGLFCYFIPPLKSYGNFILQLLGIMIFLPVVNALIIIACSKLVEVGAFGSVKIMIMVTCFAIIDGIMGLAIWHVINKTGLADAGKKVVAAGKYIAALL